MTKSVIIAVFALALVLVGASVVSAQENTPGQSLGNSAALCPLTGNGSGTGPGSMMGNGAGPGSMMQNIDPQQMQQRHDEMQQAMNNGDYQQMHDICQGQVNSGQDNGTTGTNGGTTQTPPTSSSTSTPTRGGMRSMM